MSHSSRRISITALAVFASQGCFSPNAPVGDGTGAASSEGSSSTLGGTADSTGGTQDPSDGTMNPTDAGSSGQTTADASTTSADGDSSGTSTGGVACDPLDDACADGFLCDGTECVAVPEGMVAVPGGAFMMGCNEELDSECWDNEYPYHEVVLSSFAIDRTEVTANAYAECVDDGTCSPPTTQTAFKNIECYPTSGEQPVVCVDWFQARDYCAWRDARLPTEAEWEKAARGVDGRVYPWGNTSPTCTEANLLDCPGAEALAVGSKPAGASPYGALDMAGNVFEWVSDWYSPSYYVGSPGQDPLGPDSGSTRVLRSSAYFYDFTACRASFRGVDYDAPTPDDANITIGFRCAASP